MPPQKLARFEHHDHSGSARSGPNPSPCSRSVPMNQTITPEPVEMLALHEQKRCDTINSVTVKDYGALTTSIKHVFDQRRCKTNQEEGDQQHIEFVVLRVLTICEKLRWQRSSEASLSRRANPGSVCELQSTAYISVVHATRLQDVWRSDRPSRSINHRIPQ